MQVVRVKINAGIKSHMDDDANGNGELNVIEKRDSIPNEILYVNYKYISTK